MVKYSSTVITGKLGSMKHSGGLANFDLLDA